MAEITDAGEIGTEVLEGDPNFKGVYSLNSYTKVIKI